VRQIGALTGGDGQVHAKVQDGSGLPNGAQDALGYLDAALQKPQVLLIAGQELFAPFLGGELLQLAFQVHRLDLSRQMLVFKLSLQLRQAAGIAL